MTETRDGSRTKANQLTSRSNAALLFLQLRTNLLLMLCLELKKSNETRRY